MSALNIRLGLGFDSDLSIPSASRAYPLGTEVAIESNGVQNVYKYVKATGALTAGGVYVILPSNVSGAEWNTATPATSAVAKEFGFAPVAFTAGYYGFLLVEGVVSAVSAGATTAGNTCSLANGVTTVTDEGAAVETALTVGVLNTTAGVAGPVSVIVKRKAVTI